MPDFTVASTTDTQEAVNQAAGAVQEPEVEEKETPKAPEPQKQAEKPPEVTDKSLQKMERRIGKVTAEREAAREEAESLRARLAALEQSSRQPVQQQAPPEPVQAAPEAKPKPKQEDFQTYEEWVEAVSDWKFDQRIAKMEAEAAQAEAREAEREIQETYSERVAEFKKTHADWDETINQDMTLPPGVGQTILELENGPEVAYYLGKHPDAAKRLNQMNPYTAIAEVGRIAATLGRDEAISNPGFRTDRIPVSNAPAPIKPLSGHATKSTKDLGEMDYQEYRRIRDQQEKSRYKR